LRGEKEHTVHLQEGRKEEATLQTLVCGNRMTATRRASAFFFQWEKRRRGKWVRFPSPAPGRKGEI